MADIGQLYQSVLGRAPDPEGLAYWSSYQGDPTSAFLAAAQAEKPGATYAPVAQTLTSTPDTSGVASLPSSFVSAPAYDPNKITGIESLYQTVLGRAPDVGGMQYWQDIASGGISPEEYQRFIQVAQPELQVQKAYQDVLGRQYDLPGLEYYTQQLQSGAQTPENLRRQLAYGASNLADQLAAQQYIGQNIFGTPEDLRSKYQTSFNQTLQDVFGTSDVSQLAKTLGTTPEKISYLNPAQYETSSISDIQKTLQQSQANRYQEARNIANLLPSVFGISQQDALNTARSLYSGEDSPYKSIYEDLLTKGLTPETQAKILSEAAAKAPDSPYFQANPAALQIYKPIGELKSNPESSGQYGLDPKTGLPFMSLKAAKDVMGNEVVQGANQDFREKIGQDKLGYDPHSAWQGRLANGVGVFGVTADKNEITDFDKIEKEIAKLGGVKTETDPEGNTRQVVYKDVFDPESNRTFKQAVDVRSFFPYDEYTSTDTYQKYIDTQDKLKEAAKAAGIDPSKYASTKDAYDDLNKKFENKWIVQGRTDTLPEEAAKALGIDNIKDNAKHATIQYEAVGDKLVPVKVLNTFDFRDPNTTRGVLGDIATGIGSILSVPPIAIALAMAGGLPALLSGNLGVGMAAGAGSSALAEAMAGSIFDPISLGEKVLSGLGAGTSTIAQYAPLVGQTLISSGMSGLSSGLMTGDLEKAGIAALAGALGAGVGGGTSMLLKDFDISPAAKRAASEIAGGAAATAATGQDPGQYAINRILSTGISALAGMGADKAGIPTSGPKADLFKAMLPIITSKRVGPEDVVRLAQAVKAYESKQA